MSAILSSDDLNDFISPGVACIKPVETLPSKPKKEEVSIPNSCSVTLAEFFLLTRVAEPVRGYD